MTNRTGLAVLWLTTLVLLYFGPGEYLARLVEGLDRSRLSLWPAVIAIALFLVTLTLTLRAKRPSTTTMAAPNTRRSFLIGVAKAAGGVVAGAAAIMLRLRGWATVTGPAIQVEVVTTDPSPLPEWAASRIETYRRLGRTGFEVSDIALGSGRINEENDGEAIARAALDRGVNYFDTAPDYSGNGSERALGKAIGNRRDRIFLATKFCTGEGHLPPGTPVEEYI
ncbi:MAG: aldo/keto reductase, partial [Candidatus Binatia bacterium]